MFRFDYTDILVAVIEGWVFILRRQEGSGYWLDWQRREFDKYNRHGQVAIDGPQDNPDWEQIAEAVNDVIGA
jgi:hypothetical protein